MSEKQSFKAKLRLLWRKVKDFAQLREDTDYEATLDTISKSVEFRGMNMWILVFAIIVASVGLNVNSTAVIIGAMLISPLMGPINGIGLSVGIMDEHLLQKSVKNLGIMVLVSLLASFLYFLVSPLGDAQSELLARTRPTIIDVFIAFFGVLAGIVATSRKSQSITVISGVAIATALMPPLCTAGYGLATAQFKYFFGAFYLFFLNSFFISLATFLMVRFLNFPQIQYVDHARNRAVKRITISMTTDSLDEQIVADLSELISTSPGHTELFFQLRDAKGEKHVLLRSQKGGVDVRHPLIDYIDIHGSNDADMPWIFMDESIQIPKFLEQDIADDAMDDADMLDSLADVRLDEMSKHAAFKSDVELLLDGLLA